MDWLLSLPPWVTALLATCFTYAMTALGAALVFAVRRCSAAVIDGMQGTAAGLMIAASFFSLLLPAKESLEGQGAAAALILTFGFCFGAAFILLTELWMRRSKRFSDRERRSGALTCFAMTLHNIPEGFAVGVAFGSIGGGNTFVAAAMLALGIGIQNFPEGLCAAVPLRRQGMSAGKAFFFGQLSGLVEIAAGVLGAVAVQAIKLLLPWALSFSAGAMIVVSCGELIPSCVHENERVALPWITGGFALMMLLDVLLG